MSRDPLLIEVFVALGAGRIAVGPIHCDGERVHGCAMKSGKVQINPAPEVVDRTPIRGDSFPNRVR